MTWRHSVSAFIAQLVCLRPGWHLVCEVLGVLVRFPANGSGVIKD